MKKYVWSVIILLIFLVGCKKELPEPTSEKGIQVTVELPAGSLYNDLPYLPLLGNLSYYGEDKLELLTLSKPIPKGEKIYIEPFAVLEYKTNDQNNSIVLAVPYSAELRSVEVNDLVDLSVKYSSVKRIIEQWYSSYNGLGKNEVVKWGNKSEALSKINSTIAEDK